MAEVNRSREFIPNDHAKSLDEIDIENRLKELKAKRDSFDPETQFVGIKRLGSSYTIAEPFAYFDAPSYDQLKFTRVMYASSFACAGLISCLMGYKLKGASYLTGLTRGLFSMVPLGFAGKMVYDFSEQRAKDKHDILFSYALLHEKDFPKIERKKFNDIIKNYTAHRSLNILGDDLKI